MTGYKVTDLQPMVDYDPEDLVAVVDVSTNRTRKYKLGDIGSNVQPNTYPPQSIIEPLLDNNGNLSYMSMFPVNSEAQDKLDILGDGSCTSLFTLNGNNANTNTNNIIDEIPSELFSSYDYSLVSPFHNSSLSTSNNIQTLSIFKCRTLSYWFYLDELVSPLTLCSVVSSENLLYGTDPIMSVLNIDLNFVDSTNINTSYGEARGADVTTNAAVANIDLLKINKWYNLVLVFDDDTKQILIYLDYRLIQKIPTDLFARYYDGINMFSSNSYFNNTPPYAGLHLASFYSEASNLAQFRMFNRVLTNTELMNVYYEKSGSITPRLEGGFKANISSNNSSSVITTNNVLTGTPILGATNYIFLKSDGTLVLSPYEPVYFNGLNYNKECYQFPNEYINIEKTDKHIDSSNNLFTCKNAYFEKYASRASTTECIPQA